MRCIIYTPVAAATVVAYWIWKKNQQSSFPVTGYRIPFRTTNSHRRRILIACGGGGSRARTVSPLRSPLVCKRIILYSMCAPSPPSVQIARRSLASRKKCVFISTVTISLSLRHSFSSFSIDHSPPLSLTLSARNNTAMILLYRYIKRRRNRKTEKE